MKPFNEAAFEVTLTYIEPIQDGIRKWFQLGIFWRAACKQIPKQGSSISCVFFHAELELSSARLATNT